MRMNDKLNGVPICSRNTETTFVGANPLILTLAPPDVEEIARALWQRQRDALPSDAISYGLKWRDQSAPPKFWDEFFRDAQVILALLYNKHTEYQKAKRALD
jgi:hypothetical protein